MPVDPPIESPPQGGLTAGAASAAAESYPQHTMVMDGAALGEAVSLSRAGPPPLPGFRLKGERPLGRGAFGEVWQAEKIDDGRTCAVKVFTRTGGLDWERLEREVKILVRIDEHPYIVNLIHANLGHESWPFYAMHLLRGGSLETRIHPRDPEGRRLKNPLLVPIEKAQLWFRQIADAMRFAHGKGILHCDLKPANVMLDESDNIKLVDFGQSRLLTLDASCVQGSLGTLDYMAPEQAVVASDVDAPPTPDVRWDIYSFGVIMYETLTRHLPRVDGPGRPDARAGDDLREMLSDYRMYLARTPLTLVRNYRTDVDDDLAAIVEKCLAVDPGGRYESFDAVLADFDARRERRPIAARAHDRAYLAKYFLKRHVWSAILVLFIAGLILWYRHGRDQARAERNEAQGAVWRREAEHLAQDFDAAADMVKKGQPGPAAELLKRSHDGLSAFVKSGRPEVKHRLKLAQRWLDVDGHVRAPGAAFLARDAARVLEALDFDGELEKNDDFKRIRNELLSLAGSRPEP